MLATGRPSVVTSSLWLDEAIAADILNIVDRACKLANPLLTRDGFPHQQKLWCERASDGVDNCWKEPIFPPDNAGRSSGATSSTGILGDDGVEVVRRVFVISKAIEELLGLLRRSFAAATFNRRN